MTLDIPAWRYSPQRFTLEEKALLESAGRLDALMRGPWFGIQSVLHSYGRWFPAPRDLARASADSADEGLRRLTKDPEPLAARLRAQYLAIHGAKSLEHASSLVLPVDTVPAPLLGRSRMHWIATSQRLLDFTTTHALRLRRAVAADDASPIPQHMVLGIVEAIRPRRLPSGHLPAGNHISDEAIAELLEHLYDVPLWHREHQVRLALVSAEVRLQMLGF